MKIDLGCGGATRETFISPDIVPTSIEGDALARALVAEAERDRCRAEIAELKASSSWRITAPLRRVAGAFRRAFVRPHISARNAATDYSAAVPFGFAFDDSRPAAVAVVCHLYYAHLAYEVFDCLDRIPFPADVFISTDTQDKRTMIGDAFSRWRKGNVEIRVMPNRGRDIAPKLVGFRDVHERYEFVLHIHAKDSDPNWRRFLFDTLCGSPDIVRSVFAAFACHRDLGLVFPQVWEPLRHAIYWQGEPPHDFAAHMGIAGLSDRHKHDYPAGSMFWARTAALRPLLDLNLTFDDFAEGAQLEYLIEALYLYVCERAGFDWMKIAVPAHFADRRAIVEIGAAADLDRFLCERRFRLIEQGGAHI